MLTFFSDRLIAVTENKREPRNGEIIMATDEHDYCGCEICAGGVDAFHARVERDMRDFGISVISVGPSENSPTFTYSVGFFQIYQPDVIIFGLSPLIATALLNDLYSKVSAGEIRVRDWLVDTSLANLPMTFRRADPDKIDEWMTATFAWSRKKLGRDPECYVMVWPDREGKFPWDAGFDERFRGIQPDVWSSLS